MTTAALLVPLPGAGKCVSVGTCTFDTRSFCTCSSPGAGFAPGTPSGQSGMTVPEPWAAPISSAMTSRDGMRHDNIFLPAHAGSLAIQAADLADYAHPTSLDPLGGGMYISPTPYYSERI